ncbi:MAG: InlB B-repeat-containing protein, partial [Bacteroidales bacterium]|nr:InlB B-repeat-containing protein [Bacteroidales bacterium]
MNTSIKKFFLTLGISCMGLISFGQSYTIGTGTASNYYTPYCNYYNYSVTQSLYTASEIGVGRPAKVSSIAFYVDNAYSIENQYVKIYLANTSKTSFTSTSDALASSAFTLVYSGYITIGASTGWETITLNKNFGYDGTNLVIAVAKIGTYQEPLKYRVSATTTAKTIYSCSDDEDIQGDITSCTFRNTLDSRANVKITFAEPELSEGSYRITDKYDLYWFASKVKAGNTTYNGKVTKNIVVPFSEYSYARIGNTTYHYKGTFDGSSRSINLEAESASTTSSVSYQGLFPYNEGTIQNLKYTLRNVTISGSSYVGALCGYNTGTIQSCSVNNYSETTNSVTGTSYYVGGVCGYNKGTISGCSNAATIVGSSYNVGGICGYNSSTGVVGGSNSGAIKGLYNVGGVCGKNEGGKISSGTSAANILIEATSTNSYVGGICGYNTGKMIASSYTGSNSNVKGVNYVGGVVGYNGSDSVKNFHARTNSTVTATGNYVGGVCGYNSGKLVGPNSYAVVSSSGSYVGGVVGYNTGTVGTEYSQRAIQYANVTGSQYVGGIAGYNTGKIQYADVHPQGYSDPLPIIKATTAEKAYVGGACGKNTGTIRYAYPSAVVSGTMFVGGIVGENSGKVAQSYPDYNYEGYSVTATTSSDTARCGGVCGVNLSAGTLDSCSYSGTVTGNWYVGGVCGDNAGTINKSSSSSLLSTTSGFAGGVCGNNNGTLTGCSASIWSGAMTMSGARSGGVCGNNTGTITSCYVGTSTEYSSSDKYSYTFNSQYTGGVCGYNTGTIKWCQAGNCIINSSSTYCGAICGYNTNSIVESNVLYTTVTANGFIGGVCGYNSGTISKSLARNGSVTLAGSSGYAGGIAGRNYGGTVSYCYSTVSVTQTGSASNAYVGGLVGTSELSSSKIEYSYSQGDVTAKGNYCGGLAGYSAAQITNTYAYGTVRSAGYYVGGLIGYRYSGTITNSYYLADAAADGNNKIQNGCGASSKGSTTADPSGVNKKTFFSFSSGEVCYLLNGSVNGGSPWGQAIQSDVAPMLKNTSLVYKITDSNISVYSNSADYEIPSEIAEKLANFEGDGSLENPLLIPDLQHLEDFREIVKAGFRTACGKLTADIVINESVVDENGDLRSDYRSAQLKSWIPIKNYRGCFDGDNHTIKGMFCMDVTEGKSLFENVTNGEIKNLTISDGYVKSSNLACGICQVATNSHIINCHNSCVIVTDGELPMSGGICGHSECSVIEKCSNTASVINTRTNSSVMWVGGIVGLFEQGSVVRECHNTGEVVGAYGCGGIAGMSQVGGGNLIERCYNTGLIRGNGYSNDYIGGILGLMDKNDIIRNCYNTGNIMGVRVGGIVSFVPSTSTVEYCYNAGTINGTRKGGIAAGKDDGSTVTRNYYDKTVCGNAGGINGVELSNQAYGHTTTEMCNSTLSTALNSYYDASIWQAGTTANASTEVITDDNVFGYKIIGTYPSLKGVGEPQYAKTLWVNIGTEESPQWISDFIPIYTIAQLKAISDNLDATYVLMNNVSEGANIKNGELVPSPTISWTPINRFTGKFYGLGHTISGLYTESSDEYVGLFSETEGAIINGVKIANSSFKSTHDNGQAGGIVGYSTYQYIDGNIIGTKIIDCDNVSCTVEANYEAGGIVGIAFNGSVDYCRNYGTVISNYAGRTNYAGGICGASYATISHCYNEGTVSGIGANIGGIGGGPMKVKNCYNVGTLSGGNVGGIAGSDGLGTEVYNSYSAGQLSASGSVGSVIGLVSWGASATESYYDEQVSPFDGISGSMDREGKVESRTTDELCLELQSGLSSDDWAIKEPVIKDGKKYLYYPYLKHFGEESAKVATYRQICNVVLNQNGGTCTPLTQYIEREGATLPATASRTGYTFGGWYTNASCTSERAYEIPVTATGEQTFYAKWTANSYSITLNTNGGTINSGNVTTYTYGNSVMLPTDISKTGYTFGGWYTSSSFSGSPVTSITATNYGNKSFYAKWNVNSYNITYVTNNGTINDDEYVESYDFGVAKTLPTNVTKTGYTFAGWYTNDSYSGDAVSAVSTTDFGDKTYYAKWNVNSYDITLDTDGGTINSGNITSYTYGVGATLPTDITKTGYSFAGWYDESSDELVLSILSTETGDRSFSAQWTKVPYVITLNANEGTISGNDKINYNYGDEVTLPVPTREGYTFAGWYNNSNLVGTEFTKVESTETGNKEFWAKWDVNNYIVSLDAKGGEINSGNVASYTYNVLTILPQDVTKVGHTFEGWFDSENQKVTQISKGTIGDVTFTAKWTAKTYNVTLQTNNGTINGETISSYTYGIGATLPTNITKTGYDFQGWYDNSSYDGGEVTEIASNEVGDRNFWAKWTAGIYDVTLNVAGGTINSNAIERYTYGVGAVLPTDVTKIGFTFKGWKDEDDNFALEITTADYGDKTFTAQWEQANYGITYNANGGSINESYDATYNYGNEITLPTDVTKDGCEFQGWYDNSNFTGEAVEAISATEFGNKTFYAKWFANSYSVVFNTNEGTINSGNIEGYTYGVTAILPTDVTKDGYTFTGWYSDEECEGEVVSIISSTETGNKTFYAGWSNTAYSITLHTNDGIISSGNVTAYTFGTEEQLPTEEQISKTGYKFEGWFDNASCSGEAISSVASTAIGDKQYWAKWSVNSYTVTFETDGGTINSGNVKNYIYGTTVVLPSDVIKLGYTFDGWYDNESCAGASILSISSTDLGNKTFYAKWNVNSYNVTLVTNEGTINEGNVDSYSFGTGVTLPTNVTKSGYTFDGWFTNTSYLGSAVSSVLATETGDKTFYAKWSVNTYDVTLNVNGGTITNGEIDSYTYGVGAVLPLAKNMVKTGYTFVGWYANEEFAGESVTTIANNAVGEKTFYARWTINTYDVTLNANGGTINAGAFTSYEFGTAITLPTDVTKTGYTFAGWYDNSNLVGETFTAISNGETGNKNYYAKWLVNSYNVTLEANGGVINSGNVTEYVYGNGATLPVEVSRSGYTFAGWYDANNERVVRISESDFGDKNFTAQWTANKYTITFVSNDGTINGEYPTIYNYGEEASLPADVEKNGYEFQGWYTNDSYEGEAIQSISSTDMGNKMFWAKWKRIVYTIALNTNGGTINSGNVTSYSLGATTILPTDVAKTGYTFAGWLDNARLEGEQINTIGATETGNKTFYANWLVNSYNVILVTYEGTINSENIENYTYGTGATLPTDVTKTGYTFSGWYTNSSYIGGSVASVLPSETGDKTFYAKWTVNEYKVSADFDRVMGTVTGEDYYEYKSTATLKAIANEGYEFVGWNDNELKDERIQLIVTKDTTLTANFKEKEKVEIVGTLEIPTLKTEREAAPIDLNGLFTTTEGGEVTYTASSSAPNVVSATVSEGKLFLTVYEYEGEAEITVTATLPNGEKNSVKATAEVILACNIQVEETITNVSCYGESDGEIALKVTNAAEPYTTQWQGQTSTEDTLRNVTANAYTVVITDAENCTFTKTYTVSQPEEMKLSAKIKNPTCDNADGSITITLTGAENASFAWSNESTAQNVANLVKGDYSVVITNTETGCQISDSYTLTEPEAPVVAVSNVVSTACNESNGAVTISVSEEGLLYSWSNNKTTKNLTNVPAGDYTLSVVNPETNCTATLAVTVPSIKLKQPEIALVTVSQESGKNLVVWLKENTDLIDYYTIYRVDSAKNKYDKVVDVPYSELSVYEDLAANPMERAWKYKMTA